MEKTVVYVCGTSFSGTTMLHLILGNTPDTFCCGEVYAWFRPWRPHHSRLDCSCGRRPCPAWQRVAHVPEEELYTQLFKHFPISSVVDSSKRLDWLADGRKWIARTGIQGRYVLLYKKPETLAWSYWKRKKRAGEWRSAYLRYYRGFFDLDLSFVSVSYEELVADPENKIRHLCHAVGIPYFPGRSTFLKHSHHFLFGNSGVLEQLGSEEFCMKRELPDASFEPYREKLSKGLIRDQEIATVVETLRSREVSKNEEPGLERQRLATLATVEKST